MAKGENTSTFGRRRPPSPQATRLMLFSVIASIGLAAILGYVFLPTLLYYEQLPKGPNYELAAFQVGSSFRIVIVGASLPGELGDFEVLLAVDSENHTFGPLPEGIEDLVSFFDNDNGILDVGDYFLVEFESGKTYRLLILPVDRTRDEGVGFTKWPA
ncbi:MAG: hypothetical protein V3U52_01140 [Thermoplasmata archaeon]